MSHISSNFMKQFINTFIAVILGLIVGGFLLMIGTIVVVSTITGSISSETTFIPKEKTILKIDLTGREREYIQTDPFAFLFGEDRQELSLQKQLQAISAAKNDPKIAGIYLNAKNWSTGIASAQTLRKALADFKESGKFVVAYADQYWQSTYYLCSVADKVIVNPQGSIDLHGLQATRSFYTGLMQKLGINMQIFKVGSYKSAVEPFIRKDMSAENKEQTLLFLNEQWSSLLEDIGGSRGIDTQELNRKANGILMFEDASFYIEHGLADTLLYRSETEKYLKELTETSEKKKLNFASVDEVCAIAQAPITNTVNEIAILYAEGEISDTSESLYNNTPYITPSLLKEIESLKTDENVKAVVLRVNSPGGSAYLSEQIWKELNDLKREKPLVVSMGDLAASGGYYIASCANLIVAEPTTITGSIGVFGIVPDFSGLIGKTGITFDDVKTNPHADFPTLVEPMNEVEKRAMQAYIEKCYRLFLQRCSEGRNIAIDSIAPFAEGRVWSGVSAEKIGLIDALGNIETAIRFASDLARISEYNTVNYPKQKDLLTLLLESGAMQLKLLLSPFDKEVLKEFYDVNRLKNIAPIQARIPFDMNTTL